MEILMLILVVLFLVLWLMERKSHGASKADIQSLQTAVQNLQQEADSWHSRADALSQYEGILDADAEIAQRKAQAEAECRDMLEVAKTTSDSMIAQAEAALAAGAEAAQKLEAEASAEKEAQLQAAREEAKAIRDKAKERADSILAQAEAKLSASDTEAQRIITEAETRAKEIAGEAYEIAGKAKDLEKTAKAMKNIIEGYGDQYLKPTFSLLDELAEDFGHTEAGQKLKEARSNSERMVRNGTAAACDYVQDNRKSTAIAFVVDAFNGKVDSILSKTRKDNYGTLEQKILDAYQLVNHNGQAFRNAHITPEYLAARLEELKWGVAAAELRVRAQEEQRRIREQMREEERARREYEKAMRDAAKEEEMLRRAMEKAQKQIESATEAKRAEYEAKLVDLQQKLAEAEAKGQRALSMAQQTKRGNVYVISNIGSFGENVYKVGMTRRLEPLDRVRELGDASVPFPFDVHAIIESDNAPALEAELHRSLSMLQVNKVNPRKEFFRVSLSAIRSLVEKMDLTATWTMEAEAAEYRETLAIEEKMRQDPEAQRRWEEYFTTAVQEAKPGDEEEEASA